jgi:ribosomal protein L15
MSEKVWFITGASRGFGRQWAIAALDRGDKVAATARNTDTLADLVEKGAVRKNTLVKVLGNGNISVKVDVTAHKFSGSAREKITAAGGSVTEA